MPNVYLAVIIGTVFVLGWFFGSWAMMKLYRAAASAHYRAHVFQRRESGLWVWRHHEDCAMCWILDTDDREDGDEVMLRNVPQAPVFNACSWTIFRPGQQLFKAPTDVVFDGTVPIAGTIVNMSCSATGNAITIAPYLSILFDEMPYKHRQWKSNL